MIDTVADRHDGWSTLWLSFAQPLGPFPTPPIAQVEQGRNRCCKRSVLRHQWPRNHRHRRLHEPL